MRESGTLSPPEALHHELPAQAPLETLLPGEFRPEDPGHLAKVPSSREPRLGIPRLGRPLDPDPGS